MTPEPLLTGIYRHYKGPLYLVLGYAHDANMTVCVRDTDGNGDCPACTADPESPCRQPRTVVVYVGLELDEAHHGARLAVRTASDFAALLHPDATICGDPMRETPLDWFCHCRAYAEFVRLTRRFSYIGPTWEGQR